MSIVGLVVSSHDSDNEREPVAAELAAIEAEWPLIRAELDVVDAEIQIASAGRRPAELDWQRLRRAERRVLALRDITRRPASVRTASEVA